jgi:regulator of protease activity HflC (stomatin/prohibitin superfamily)
MKNRSIFSLITILAIATMFQSCTRIDAGHVGLKVSYYGSDKGVTDIAEVSGVEFYNPFTSDVIEFPTFTQSKDYEPFVITAKGGAEFTVDPTISYYVRADRAPHIYRQYRKPLEELENGILKNLVYDSYRITVNHYSPDSLVNNRERFENELQETLNAQLDKEGFVLQQLTSKLDPPATLKAAIDQKNLAVQQSLQTHNLVEREKAQADIEVAKAEGAARAKRIEADGINYYNEKIQQSLSPQLLQKQYLEKWNGVLPSTMTGGSTPVMMINPK